MQGIGLVIGDRLAVACGWAGDGTEWSVAQPVAVCAPSSTSMVELLLAGDEAAAAGQPSLLTAPRRWGYVTGSVHVARDLLAALLATLRQQVPVGLLERPSYPPVLVLSHRVSAAAAEVVAQAAADAGWGGVRIVSELAALAALSSGDGDTVAVTFGDGSGEGAAPDEAELALGGARIAALQLTVLPVLPLAIGLVVDDGAVVELGLAGQPGRYVRALEAPDPDGSLIRLTAADQVVLEAVVEPVGHGGPWLLQVDVAEGMRGEVCVTAPDGTTVVNRPFVVRLP